MLIGYTTPEDVIIESGLSGDKLDPKNLMRTKLAAAESIVNGVISNIYTLPLAWRYKNYIDFSGEGTGAGTITIIINSVTFTVTITDGLTASQAADLFRDALDDSDTIFADTSTDFAGNERVAFCSLSMVKATAITQVTVTNSPAAAAGITPAVATRLSKSFPSIIELTTRQIACALLLKEAFGKNAQDTANDGAEKFTEAMEFLDLINEGTIKVVDNLAGTELTKDGSVLPQFTPTQATRDSDSDADGHTPNNFRYNEQF